MIVARSPRPLAGVRGLDAAVERYTTAAFEVDRAHRRFEQRQATLLDSQVPHFGDLKACVHVLRTAYRAWADQLARDFAAVCREGGFLPDAALQQRNVFEQVVQPLAADDKVAFLLLDAFRYEMATELLEELKAPGTVVDLKARLAELPTVTAVGMNVLAPVTQGGRLQVAGTFAGFKTGEFTVRSPERPGARHRPPDRRQAERPARPRRRSATSSRSSSSARSRAPASSWSTGPSSTTPGRRTSAPRPSRSPCGSSGRRGRSSRRPG